jgi:DNA-binding NarL/FixJ family response regulator
MPETTVLICDTEPVAVEGLRCLLGAGEGLRVAAAETCLATGLDAVRELRPELVVLDKGFGLQPVLEALRVVGSPECGARAVVWGVAVSDAEALRFLHAGAAGVVRKTAALSTLLECFGAVASGMTWMEDGLIQTAEAPVRSSRLPLTARELQVVDLVERGMTNRAIAGELGIRTGTVKIHLKHIFEKTGVRGRYGLALCGLKEKGVLLAPVVI